jgi:hypothetical protein
MKKAQVVVPYAGYYLITVEVEDDATDDDAFDEAVEVLSKCSAHRLHEMSNEEEWLPKLISDYGSKNFSCPDEFEVNWY